MWLLLLATLFVLFYIFQSKTERFNQNDNAQPLHFSQPYNYKYGGTWPPDMYSKLKYWSPGFYNGSGLSLQFRPGMEPTNYPRNRWINKTTLGNSAPYYYVSNRADYSHNMANYSELPLRFRT